jgi:hypothetical protein
MIEYAKKNSRSTQSVAYTLPQGPQLALVNIQLFSLSNGVRMGTWSPTDAAELMTNFMGDKRGTRMVSRPLMADTNAVSRTLR